MIQLEQKVASFAHPRWLVDDNFRMWWCGSWIKIRLPKHLTYWWMKRKWGVTINGGAGT